MSNRLNSTPMTLDQAIAKFPSLTNEGAHTRVGNRYEAIPTIDTLKALDVEGFQVTNIQYAKTRDISRRGFQKHLIRMRHPDYNWGTEFPEVVAVNSFDGSSSWQLWAGVYRFICANGLVVGAEWAKHTVQHRGGDITERVVTATHAIRETFDRVAERVDVYKRTMLTAEMQVQFAEQAAAIRWQRGVVPMSSDRLLSARRSDDLGDSLWNVYNRVQENAIQGGQRVRHRGARGFQWQTVKSVNNIRDNVEINRRLSLLADEFAVIAA